MAGEESAGYGSVADVLLADGHVSEEQLRYAKRVREKLGDARPLIALVKELHGVSDGQIRASLSRHRTHMRLGELLVELGRIGAAELQSALEAREQSPEPKPRLGELLVSRNLLSEADLVEVLSVQLGFPREEPSLSDLDAALLSVAPAAYFERHEFLPVRREGDEVVVAFIDPLDREALDAAQTLFDPAAVVPAIAAPAALRRTLAGIGGKPGGRASAELDPNRVVKLVDEVLTSAVEAEASDVHVEPMGDRLRVRFRQDGVLVTYREFPVELAAAVSSRIKVLCKADIAERRRHQDGRMVHKVGAKELDVRVSIYATVHGEKTVMRLLNRDRQLLRIDEIGMAPRMVERFLDDALELPSGVIIVTGPTGSGKTSTLYSCVAQINRPDVCITTAEDPVEYVIDGISQCSLNPAIDLTFEETLRHIVRQDPDIIVIGEIRDTFSAETAIQAALTGHKVLTTFHTEDTIGGLVRLLNMDIEAFLVSSTVVSVLAQRLLRRVCPECAQEHTPTTIELRRLGYVQKDLEEAGFKMGRGCEACRYTGYKGRIAAFELLVMDQEVRDAVLGRKTSHEIRRICRESSGLLSLLEDGIVKAARGVTTLEEVLRMLPRLDQPRPLNQLRRLLGE